MKVNTLKLITLLLLIVLVYIPFLLSSSPDTESDTIYDYTVVTNGIFGRDNNIVDGKWGLGRSCGGMVLGVKYDILDDDTLFNSSTYK